jgi:WhiB family redox-sensing transcriptional regulator
MTDISFGADYPIFTDELGVPVCSESWPDAFFSDEQPDGMLTRRSIYSMEREAKKSCSVCPYIAECLAYAIKDPELVGIWGGTTENDRRNIRRRAIIARGGTPSRNC